MACLAQIDQAKMAAAEFGVGGYWKDPNYQRGTCVNTLRDALRSWAKEVSRMKKRDADLSTSIQNCARLEQNFIAVQNCGIDPDTFQCTHCKPSGGGREHYGGGGDALVHGGEESGGAGRVVPAVRSEGHHQGPGDVCGVRITSTAARWQFRQTRRSSEDHVRRVATEVAWRPRRSLRALHLLMVVVGCGGMQQLLEQYLHSAVSYHAKALEQFSGAFAAMKRASKQARDVAYIHTLAAAAGLSVKEYQRLLEMFNRIDQCKIGLQHSCSYPGPSRRMEGESHLRGYSIG
ncbi:uncharacterized protein [Physcomitrium patens]|uniref:uncharacterized protein isoform X4 n=1 Tax=Physcomitrium patens TaxID=3218 RepID=UPI003CCDF4F1